MFRDIYRDKNLFGNFLFMKNKINLHFIKDFLKLF